VSSASWSASAVVTRLVVAIALVAESILALVASESG
jgi:hypothetical protein